jgi:hypothetical protein
MNNCNLEFLSLSYGHIDQEKKRTTFWSESLRQSLPANLKNVILTLMLHKFLLGRAGRASLRGAQRRSNPALNKALAGKFFL